MNEKDEDGGVGHGPTLRLALVPGWKSPDGHDSKGRGLDEASVAAVVDKDKAVQWERHRVARLVAQTYRNPEVATTAMEAHIEAEGVDCTVEMMKERPETFGRLRGRYGLLASRNAELDHAEAISGARTLGDVLPKLATTIDEVAKRYRAKVVEQIQRDQVAVPDVRETASPAERQRFMTAFRERFSGDVERLMSAAQRGEAPSHPSVPPERAEALAKAAVLAHRFDTEHQALKAAERAQVLEQRQQKEDKSKDPDKGGDEGGGVGRGPTLRLALVPGWESPDGHDSKGRGLDEASVRAAVDSSPHVVRERQSLEASRAALEAFERRGTGERLAGFLSGRSRTEREALTRTVAIDEAALAHAEERAAAEYRYQVREQLRRDSTPIPSLGTTPKDERRFLEAVRERLGGKAMQQLKAGQRIDHPEIPRQALDVIGRGLREIDAREAQRAAERQAERERQRQERSLSRGLGRGL